MRRIVRIRIQIQMRVLYVSVYGCKYAYYTYYMYANTRIIHIHIRIWNTVAATLSMIHGWFASTCTILPFHFHMQYLYPLKPYTILPCSRHTNRTALKQIREHWNTDLRALINKYKGTGIQN